MDQKSESNGSSKRRGLFLMIGAVVSLTLGIYAGNRYRDQPYTHKDVVRFEKILHAKEQFLEEEFAVLEKLFDQEPATEVLNNRSDRYQELANRKGISLFYFEDENLVYWSDHSIPLSSRWRGRLSRHFLSLRNADYVTVSQPVKEGMLLGLIEIRTHYPFQNKFLVNGFQDDFNLDEKVGVRILEADGTEAVYSSGGTYLFSLDFSEATHAKRGMKALAVLSLLVFAVCAFAGFCRLMRLSKSWGKWLCTTVITLLVAGAVISVVRYSFPSTLTDSDLFQPDLYASRFFASMGSLLVFTLGALALAVLYYRYIDPLKLKSQWARRLISVFLFSGATLLLMVIESIINSLVLDSTISFEIHRVTTFSVYTVIGLTVIVMWFVILGLVLDRAVQLFSTRRIHNMLAGVLSISAVMGLLALLPDQMSSWVDWIFLLLLLGSFLYLRSRPKEGKVRFSRFIFILLCCSVWMVVRLQEVNRVNLEHQKEVELVKLSSEHDPVAEMLFSELAMAIRNDSMIALYLNSPVIDIDQVDQVVDRLRRNYFSGYWSKYELWVTICHPNDMVYIEYPDDEWQECYPYFDQMISESGIEVPGSDFYFMDNLNGRISYLAAIPYYRSGNEFKVFIELDSKIISEELGYPELLLDVEYITFTSSDFSYAKYSDGQLITQDGEFPYRRSSKYYTEGKEMFERITLDGYDHTIYNVDDRNTIIVGSPTVTAVDSLISFSYIFTFNFLLLALVYLMTMVRLHRPTFNWNFKNRIQYTMVGVLFLTFILICTGTIYFIIQQYRDKHNDNLRNTMRSVYIELVHKLEYEEDLRNWSSEEYYNLDELLRKFSNVFYTDINLYDVGGNLLASSRSEIFDRQLLSRRMNRLVYENMTTGSVSEFIHDEHIGGMKYISAYVPLLNSENRFLAYLNLPYFTQSGALTQDVTNLVMAVINIYLILLLVILFVSVLLADRITQPLRMIQNRIAKLSLSKENEMIQYNRSDEIRGLVEEYNYMVRELEKSAQLLAQSERESAWREMAKQIAHEIKNPLTPMKLNVQHLQRAIDEGKADPEMVDRIAATLIEQIDSLSAIANEFSDFAKMPRAKNERINLVTNLKNLLQLYENTSRAEVTLDLGTHKKVFIFGDKEQLSRVFINLVRNGLQSIPETRKGKIRIRMEIIENEKVRVTVNDNGKGIPEGIKDRLFQPNFTTKSGGMGMGLAISYNIVRSLGGKIWFDTELDKGTTFFVELPLLVEKS
jgi:two-component system nitrogen regulation sensor histidine kinase NtrY